MTLAIATFGSASAGFAPAVSKTTPFQLTTTEILIIIVVLIVGLVFILGWRSPDRSPHHDEKIEREEEE